ncbi:MAG: class I SAM-dependent methyltransferase [Heliobacteriaceae bacterium]|jgi:2-polyprenyl-3-methyl-5-hydroxy-6-metoxy-1,4-benzoquinol methylase|nr:class I SAM-dependent methyltransferase [Heliobacteriaceae bacterium]
MINKVFSPVFTKYNPIKQLRDYEKAYMPAVCQTHFQANFGSGEINEEIRSEKQTWNKQYEGDWSMLPWAGEEPTNSEKKYIDRFLTGKNQKILEYGCGTGKMASYLASQGHDVLAAEYSDVAVKKIKSTNPPFEIMEASAPSDIKDKNFDMITCIGVFHHQPPEVQEEFLKSFSQMITPDGQIIIMGWDDTDPEFVAMPKRISKQTKTRTWTINHLENVIPKYGLRIKNPPELINFTEIGWNADRILRCYVIERS